MSKDSRLNLSGFPGCIGSANPRALNDVGLIISIGRGGTPKIVVEAYFERHFWPTNHLDRTEDYLW